MAKQRIDAIIIQKIATEAEWNNIGRVPEKGEFMLIQNTASQPVNLKIGDGNRAFTALPNFIQYDQAAYVAPSGNTLPVPQNGVGYSLLTEGSYNGGSLVVPAGNLGKAEYIGNAWILTNMPLPTANININQNVVSNSQDAVSSSGVYQYANGFDNSYNVVQSERARYAVGSVADGQPLPAKESSTTTWLIDISVNQGQILNLTTVGGNAARAWTFVRTNGTIHSKSVADNTLSNTEITVPVNGRVIVQYFNSSSIAPSTTQFVVRLRDSGFLTPIKTKLDETYNLSNSNAQVINEKLVSQSYSLNINDAQRGRYDIGTTPIGGDIPPFTGQTTSWAIVINVVQGQDILITTVGGNAARAWGFFDSLGKLHSKANQNVTLNNQTLVSPVNGTLIIQYFNTNGTVPDLTQFKVDYESFSEIDALSERVSNLESGATDLRSSRINVLIIGNSFSWYGSNYLPRFLADLGYTNFCIRAVGHTGAGGTFQGNLDKFSSTQVSVNRRALNAPTYTDLGTSDGTTIQSAVRERVWDFIVVHQWSGLSGSPNYSAGLTDYVKRIRRDLTDITPSFGIQVTWPYAIQAGYPLTVEGVTFATQTEWMGKIGDNSLDAISNIPIFVRSVPSGTAVQNARSTQLGVDNNDFQASGSDNIHINSVGQYIASMAFFMELVGLKHNVSYDTARTSNPLSLSTANMNLVVQSVQKAMSSKFINT